MYGVLSFDRERECCERLRRCDSDFDLEFFHKLSMGTSSIGAALAGTEGGFAYLGSSGGGGGGGTTICSSSGLDSDA
jgi:hypothetical protein